MAGHLATRIDRHSRTLESVPVVSSATCRRLRGLRQERVGGWRALNNSSKMLLYRWNGDRGIWRPFRPPDGAFSRRAHRESRADHRQLLDPTRPAVRETGRHTSVTDGHRGQRVTGCPPLSRAECGIVRDVENVLERPHHGLSGLGFVPTVNAERASNVRKVLAIGSATPRRASGYERAST